MSYDLPGDWDYIETEEVEEYSVWDTIRTAITVIILFSALIAVIALSLVLSSKETSKWTHSSTKGSIEARGR